MQSYKGASERVFVSKELLAGLKELSRCQGVTLFITLSAAFKVWLNRYSGQDDIVVGTPIANRNRGETEGLIGFFVNTLALRTDMSGDPSFKELLKREREVAMGAYEHQDVPFERLVAELQVERDLSRNPLFQVMFVLQNMPKEALKLEGLEFAPAEMEQRTAKFDLWLTLSETEAGLNGRIEYGTDLFDGATIRRWIGHWERLLTEVVGNSGKKVSELEILSKEERRQLLEEWNNTRADYPKGKCIHELFEEQAERTPENVAVVFEEQQLTYRELNERANQLAHYLRGLGVISEVRVGICLERSVDMVVGLLGILKSGGAYVPLDPAYPAKRLGFMMEDAQMPVLLTHERWVGHLLEHKARVVCLDRDWPAISGQDTGNPTSKTMPLNMAYVIYTSGSTGQPKGTMNTHEGLCNRLIWMQEEYRLTPADHVLQKTPFGFDVSVWEFFWPLLAGASLVVARPGGHREPEYLAELIWRKKITTLHFVPSMLQVFLEGPGLERCSCVKRVICSGEALSRGLQDRFFERMTAELYNLYGPTEASIDVTFWVCERDSPLRTVPIGKPIANTKIYLLDDQQQLVPLGVPGELHIAGVGLARGYYNRPELTAERFIPNPYSPESGGRLYRTGDMARYLADGSIEYLDRRDNQVKIRGLRIELGEIEAVLEQHPGVQQSIVIAREDEPGDKQLVGYVVANPDTVREMISVKLRGAQVEEWETVFDDTYNQSPEPVDSGFNIVGWNSSFTGEPIPAEEMAEWLGETLDDVRHLDPTRVLEIGCGTGMVLFGLAGKCAEYWATDFSRGALAYIKRQMEQAGLERSRIHLLHRTADNFKGISNEKFDCVILNSVVQYFPDIEYLLRVLEGAVNAVSDGGHIYLGDVRSFTLLEVFHTAVELHKAVETLPLGQLKQRIRSQIGRENELVVDPGFFFALQRRLPRIRHVEIKPKRGHVCNELTQFRYQVILHVGVGPELVEVAEWLDGEQEKRTLEELRQLLQVEHPDEVGVRGIANKQLRREVLTVNQLRNSEATRQVGELLEELRREPADGVAPWELYELGKELAYNVEVSWARHGTDGRLDVVFWRVPAVESQQAPNKKARARFWDDKIVSQPWTEYANNPLQNKLMLQLVPQLRSYLLGKLPDYMVPAFLVILEQLPLTANGKVDRKALPMPERGRLEMVGEYVEARNEVEAKLVEIWSEVLGIERVGVHDNFFELGGHSLLAVQVITRVRSVFKVELPVRSLFEAPTVAGLSERVEALRDSGVGLAVSAIQRVGRDRPLPLSYAEEQFWFVNQLYPNSAGYNMFGALRILDGLQVEVLERTINEIVRRHEVLRTTFETTAQGQPVQVIHEHEWRSVPMVDLEALSERKRMEQARQLIEEERLRPFDLSQGPVVRGRLLRMGLQEHVMLYTVHHIASDGWSMGVLNRELGVLYEAFANGQPSPLPELPIQYADFAVWQREWLQGEALEKQLNYWKEQLAGVIPLQLPTDYPRPMIQSFNGAAQVLRISSETAEGLKRLCQDSGVTLFMTLLAGFEVLLGRYSGQEDIAVGSPIANRNREETERLIGLFANMLVMRTDLSRDPTVLELLQRVKVVTLGAYANPDLPFEKLVEELQPERDMSRNPLVQILFALQNAPDEEVEMKGAALQSFGVAQITTRLDLEVHFWESKQGLAARFIYNTNLFEAETIRRIGQHLGRVLEWFVRNPGQRISEVDLLSATEREQIVAVWNSTGMEYPRGKCVPELFEEQAERSPDAVAVMYESEQLTYDELNRKANQLAHDLCKLGVGPEVRVGICMERSPEMIIGFLGVLKAGGAYVPLDPDYPQEQLAFMLEDAGITVLLTQEHLRQTVPRTDATVIYLDQLRATITDKNQGNVDKRIGLENLAYVAFVLGPNGRFQGVGVSHGALNRLFSGGNIFKFGPDDNVAQISPIWSGMSNFEIWGALLHGGRLTDIRENGVRSPAEFIAQIKAAKITTLFLSTPLFNQLAHADPSFCRGIRQVLFGGGVPEPELARKVLQQSAPGKLLHVYGEMDWGIFGLAYPVDLTRSIPIGRPVSNTKAYILDQFGNLAAIGAAGELYLDDGLVRGCLNCPEWTAEKFVPDSFSQKPGRRLYRTGDRTRYLPDGNIELIKPMHRQGFIRGVRVDLNVLERTILQNSDIGDCFLVIRKTEISEFQLVAYIVVQDSALLPGLRVHLTGILPSQLLPDIYVPVSALPLMMNGEVDERALYSLEVIDSDLIGRWEKSLRSLPEIEEAAVIIGARNEKSAALHLSDLLPNAKVTSADSDSGGSLFSADAVMAKPDQPKKCKPAFSSGGELKRGEAEPKTLPEALQRAGRQAADKGILYIRADGSQREQSYGALLVEAQRIMAGLNKLGLKPQDKVIFQLEDNEDFIPAFWGCQLGGYVPVPLSIAPNYRQVNSAVTKLHSAWQMLEKPIVLTSRQLAPSVRFLSELLGLGDFRVVEVEELRLCDDAPEWHISQAKDLALLLLTSGSTGTPKAAMLSHANILSRSAGTVQLDGFSAEDVSFNWMPLDHVGGIVMFHIRDVYACCRQIHAPSSRMLENPLEWLHVIDHYRVTITWAPNFAFGLINERAAELARGHWDLSSMKFILNGGELIVARTARRFLELLRPHGLKSTTMHPAWGMSETSSGVTSSHEFTLETMQDEDIIVEVGRPLPGISLRIVNFGGQVVEEGEIGRLQVKGAAVISGYYRNPELNAEVFSADGWFNTGDLAMLREGRLTITGREKDVIIINGKNYYSHEIEAAVEQVEGVNVSFSAACGIRDRGSNTDRLTLFFNPAVLNDGGLVELLQKIRQRVVQQVGVNPDYLIPVSAEAIPKTVIGKIQRAELKRRFEEGQFDDQVKQVDILCEHNNTLPDWFYQKVWRPKKVRILGHRPANGQYLVFADNSGLGIVLAERLESLGCSCIVVEAGREFVRLGSKRYQINHKVPEDYRRLLEFLVQDKFRIDQIVHLWTYGEDAGEMSSVEELRESQYRGLYSVVFLVQALAKIQGGRSMQLQVISSHAQPVSQADKVACEKSTLVGLIKTIPLELSWLQCSYLDLSYGPAAENTQNILRELCLLRREAEVAYRNGCRFVPVISKVNMLRQQTHEVPFKQGGTYLLTGGLGGIGTCLAEFLIKEYQARLIIIGRTVLPDRIEWPLHQGQQTIVAKRIGSYLKIEATGGEFVYVATDVCDLAGLRRVVASAESKWNQRLSGVIHLAGEGGQEKHQEMISQKLVTTEDLQSFESMFHAKVYGTWSLWQLLENNPDATFIGFSSVYGIFGAAFLGSYSAANSFLDACCYHQQHSSHPRTYCFNWSEWDELGMSEQNLISAKQAARRAGYQAISREQGWHSLLAGLYRGQARLIVGLEGGNRAGHRYVEEGSYQTQEVVACFASVGKISSEELMGVTVKDRFQTPSKCKFRHVREIPLTPTGEIDREKLLFMESSTETKIRNELVAPRNEVERQLAQIWQELLRVSQIGIHDDFFVLGGHSLLASQMVSRVRNTFGVELPLASVFQSPILSSLAEIIEWGIKKKQTPVVTAGERERGTL